MKQKKAVLQKVYVITCGNQVVGVKLTLQAARSIAKMRAQSKVTFWIADKQDGDTFIPDPSKHSQ